MVPGAAAAAAPASDGAGLAAHAMPFPAEQIGNALNTLDGILTQLYQGYLPLLAKGELTAEPLKQLAGAASDAFSRLLAGMAVFELILSVWLLSKGIRTPNAGKADQIAESARKSISLRLPVFL